MTPADDLDAILDFVWHELTRAASDGESQFRHAQLSTIGDHGWPQSRSVIIRHADTKRHEVGFHTDRRSTKAGEIEAHGGVALVAYDRPRGIQIRLWGQAQVHCADQRARVAWDALYPPLRAPYRATRAPGTPIDDPASSDVTEAMRNPADADEGFENFAFVPIVAARLEYLHLRPTGHRRARFRFRSTWEGSWITP